MSLPGLAPAVQDARGRIDRGQPQVQTHWQQDAEETAGAMKKRGGAAGGRRSCRLIYESDAITRQTLDNNKNNADNGNNTKPREDRNYNKRPLSKTFYKEKL